MVDGDPGRTVWEFIDDDGGVESGLRNTDHAFSSGAAWLLSEYVAGIRPTSPGFATFDIVPHPGELGWVQCTMPTPMGGLSIDCTIDAEEQTFDAELDVPAGATGRVAVPRLGTVPIVVLDGELLWSPDGPTGGATDDGHHLYFPDVGPGSHTVAAVFDQGIVDPDFDFDFDVDLNDFAYLQACLGAPGLPAAAGCIDADLDGDGDVDQDDYRRFDLCMSGPEVLPDPACED
jgi:hypothetical protein